MDKTARPGPSTWEAGDYPEGTAEHPVGGVSWFEAAAYARFMKKQLPTIDDWEFAVGGADANWIWPASNMDGSGPAAVGSFKGIAWSGAFDLIGNVREWVFNAQGSERFVMGGSWTDESAFYNPRNIRATVSAFDRSPVNGLRLVWADSSDPTRAAREAPISVAVARDVSKEPVVTDSSFETMRHLYDYEAVPLHVVVERVDTSDNWIREWVTFYAAYSGERMSLYLYLPRSGSPPYQTVVYYPGAPAFFLDSIDQYQSNHWEFLPRNGRAFAFPVYLNTFQRRLKTTVAGQQQRIRRVNDARRAVDYLVTRRDVDSTKIAYFGYSAGGSDAPAFLALEPRFRSAVLYMAGLQRFRANYPEVEPVTFLPRVHKPVLMLSGALDDGFPLETSARPFFQLLGTAPEHKRHVVAPGSHFVPRPTLIRETLDWLDRYLGPVR